MQPPVISFEAIFEQSSAYSPVVFILSPGSDPVSDLMKLAEKIGFGGDKLKLLAMGQGQEKVTLVGGEGRAVCKRVCLWIANRASNVEGLSRFPFQRPALFKMEFLCGSDIAHGLPAWE